MIRCGGYGSRILIGRWQIAGLSRYHRVRYTALLALLTTEMGQRQAGHKKHSRQKGGGTGQKRRRPPCPKQSLRCSTTERRTSIRTTPMLEQHQRNQGDGHGDMNKHQNSTHLVLL